MIWQIHFLQILIAPIANKKLEENFDVNSIYMILADSELNSKDANKMMTEIKDLDGVHLLIWSCSAIGNEILRNLYLRV